MPRCKVGTEENGNRTVLLLQWQWMHKQGWREDKLFIHFMIDNIDTEDWGVLTCRAQIYLTPVCAAGT